MNSGKPVGTHVRTLVFARTHARSPRRRWPGEQGIYSKVMPGRGGQGGRTGEQMDGRTAGTARSVASPVKHLQTRPNPPTDRSTDRPTATDR